jgi:regulator of replication initiation timing
MEDQEIMIASLRKELQETHSKCSALEQENALLQNEVERLNRKLGKGKTDTEKAEKTGLYLK